MLQEIVLENNHNIICGYPLTILVMSSKEKLKCRKVKLVSDIMSSQKPKRVCPPYIIYVLSLLK